MDERGKPRLNLAHANQKRRNWLPMSDQMQFHEAEHKLRSEHTKRYDAFILLSLSLSFGGLMFLLAFQKDCVTPKSTAAWLVDTAWFLMSLSSLTAIGLQIVRVINPIRRLENARMESHPEHGKIIYICGKPSTSEIILFWLHMATLLAGIVVLSIYKALNLCTH